MHVQSTRVQRLASSLSGPRTIYPPALALYYMATLEEQNFLYAMLQKNWQRTTNSPFAARLPFLYDFLGDEGWLQLAQQELFANSLRAVSL